MVLKVILLKLTFLFFLARPHSIWDLSSPNQELNLCLLLWKHGILTAGQSRKFPEADYSLKVK